MPGHLKCQSKFPSRLQGKGQTQVQSEGKDKQKFDELVHSIIQGNYEMQKMDIVDLTFQFGQEGPGYVTKDDILSFPIGEGDPTYRHHLVVPLSITDRIVVDALSDVLLLKGQGFLAPKVHMYGKTIISGDINLVNGISPDLQNEFHSWEGVRSVAVFDIHGVLSRVDLNRLFFCQKKSVNADPQVWKCFFSYFSVANEQLRSLSKYSVNGTPFRGLPLIGSLPVVLVSIFCSVDSCVTEFIGDWPYVRLNYELIFPIYGATSIDEEPYLELYDFFFRNGVQVEWLWLSNHSGINSIRTGFLHLDLGKVFFTDLL